MYEDGVKPMRCKITRPIDLDKSRQRLLGGNDRFGRSFAYELNFSGPWKITKIMKISKLGPSRLYEDGVKPMRCKKTRPIDLDRSQERLLGGNGRFGRHFARELNISGPWKITKIIKNAKTGCRSVV